MEEIIGTWIDGKPIYRQCFMSDNLNPDSKYAQYVSDYIDISALNYDTIVRIACKTINPTSGEYQVDGNNFTNSTEFGLITTVNGNNIRIQNNQSWGSSYTAGVTLYYTKTTD